jgi:membrane protein
MPAATARNLAREFSRKWSEDHVGTHGAALAYYALFSIAPLLVVVIAVAGLVLGETVATSEIVSRIEQAIGPEPARVVGEMIAQVSSPRSGLLATLLGLATVLLGATGVLVRLQGTLRHLWGAESRGGVRGTLRRRAVGLGLILGLGLLVFVSMVLATVLNALHASIAVHFPIAAALAGPVNVLATLALNGAAFAALFRILPGVRTPWRDLWVGGLVTAMLFALGTQAIAWYLGRASTSVYGAASSLVLLVLWVYYSAQILLAGAVFTVVWSRRHEPPAGAAAGG